MRDFFSILSQLGWGLTVGALGATFATLAQGAGLVVCLLGGGGCALWWRRRKRARSSLPNRPER
jgi:hypothetical protein